LTWVFVRARSKRSDVRFEHPTRRGGGGIYRRSPAAGLSPAAGPSFGAIEISCCQAFVTGSDVTLVAYQDQNGDASPALEPDREAWIAESATCLPRPTSPHCRAPASATTPRTNPMAPVRGQAGARTPADQCRGVRAVVPDRHCQARRRSSGPQWLASGRSSLTPARDTATRGVCSPTPGTASMSRTKAS
jgi:hypothetical protein